MGAGFGKTTSTKPLDKLFVGSNHPVTEEIMQSPVGAEHRFSTCTVNEAVNR